VTKSIGDIATRIVAEQATGIAQRKKSLGKYYVSESLAVSPRTAYEMMRRGQAISIHLPNAGAGSYKEFFESLGLDTVQAVDLTSSAGDWSFAVKDGAFWYPATQTNRCPRAGFSYCIQYDRPYDTFERLRELMFQ